MPIVAKATAVLDKECEGAGWLAGGRGTVGIASCWRELLRESRMAAGLMGTAGRGTVRAGLRLGLARRGRGSTHTAEGVVVVGGGGGGGEGGRLVWAWGCAVGVGLLLLEVRGDEGCAGGTEEEREEPSLPCTTAPPPPLPLASFFLLFRLHISWQSWVWGRLRTENTPHTITPSHCTHHTLPPVSMCIQITHHTSQITHSEGTLTQEVGH